MRVGDSMAVVTEASGVTASASVPVPGPFRDVPDLAGGRRLAGR
ncbi:hypothetical protein [Streptomyces sparsus]